MKFNWSKWLNNQSAVVKAIFSVGMLKILSTLISVLVTIACARLLGPKGFGIYSYALALVGVVSIPVIQGLPVLVLRQISRALPTEQPSAIRMVLRFSDQLTWLVGLSAIVVVFLIGSLFTQVMHEGGTVLWLAAAAVPVLTVVIQVRGSILRALGHPFLGQLGDMLVRPGVLLLVLLTMLAFTTASSVQVMVANAAACCAGLFFAHVTARSHIAKATADRQVVPYGTWMRSLVPLSLLGGLQFVNSQVDLLVLGFLVDKESVGIYKIASTLALQVSFGLTVVNAVVAPKFAELYRRGDIQALKRLNKMSAMVSFALGAVVTLGYFLIGEWVIQFAMGKGYGTAFMPLMILSTAHLLTLWAGTTNVLLTMLGHERDVLVAAVVSISINFVLNLVLVPQFGMIGAASATAIALAIWRGMLSVYVRLRLNSTLVAQY